MLYNQYKKYKKYKTERIIIRVFVNQYRFKMRFAINYNINIIYEELHNKKINQH